jgi:hypothetical protein
MEVEGGGLDVTKKSNLEKTINYTSKYSAK